MSEATMTRDAVLPHDSLITDPGTGVPHRLVDYTPLGHIGAHDAPCGVGLFASTDDTFHRYVVWTCWASEDEYGISTWNVDQPDYRPNLGEAVAFYHMRGGVIDTPWGR